MIELKNISSKPLVQLCDVGEASATLSFKPSEVDVDKVLSCASTRVDQESSGMIRLREFDLEFGLLQLYRQPNSKAFDLEWAARIVAEELARTCIASPSFDETLYSEPA